MANALRADGVPFSIAQNESFFNLEETQQLNNLLRSLNPPLDPIALTGVLRSPLIGLSDLEIVRLHQSLNGEIAFFFDARAIEPELRFVCERLAKWKAASTRMTASRLLETAVQDSLCDERGIGPALYSGQLKNIFRLIDELREAEQTGLCDGSLESAICWFELKRSEKNSSPDSYDGSHPVVLSTVHKAKGLEFPMVVLPFIAWSADGDNDPVLFGEAPDGARQNTPSLAALAWPRESYRLMPTLKCWLEKSAEARDRAETRRLFYVACTRAREYLVFAGNLPRDEEAVAGETAQNLFLQSSPKEWLRELLVPGPGGSFNPRGEGKNRPLVQSVSTPGEITEI
jgi:ATP-dependent helicase/nuclease subunit A